jgi:hypothetical protein
MDHNHSLVAILSMVIPIVAIIMGVGIGMLSLLLQFRRKRDMFQLYHAERMAAIEKGIELPPLPPEFFQDTGRTAPAPVRHRTLRSCHGCKDVHRSIPKTARHRRQQPAT